MPPMPRCRILLAIAVVAGCVGTLAVTRPWRSTDRLTLSESLSVAGENLTPAHRHLVVAALRRRSLEAVRRLILEAEERTLAGDEAREALRQLRELLR